MADMAPLDCPVCGKTVDESGIDLIEEGTRCSECTAQLKLTFDRYYAGKELWSARFDDPNKKKAFKRYE